MSNGTEPTPVDNDAALIAVLQRSRQRMDEIRNQDAARVEDLTRLQNASIYIASLEKEETKRMRNHAIELMLRGILGVSE